MSSTCSSIRVFVFPGPRPLLLTPGFSPDFLLHPLHWPSICIFWPQPLICVSCLEPLISMSGSGLGLQFDFTGHESLLFYLLIYLFKLVKRILLTSFEMCIDILRKCFRLNYFWITFLGILELSFYFSHSKGFLKIKMLVFRPSPYFSF